MTTSKNLFAECPDRIEKGSGAKGVTFKLQTDRHAVHESGSDPQIVDGDPGEGAKIGPVYAIQPSGGIAVPTGLVFIRFKSGVKASDRKSELEKVGYVIAEEIGYAPEAVWVRERSGDIASSLGGLSKLEKIKDVENVEPQMLMPRVSR